MPDGPPVQPNLEFIREIRKTGGETLTNCYQCATCSTVCSLSPADKPFPRKEMLMTQWGQDERLVKDPDIWLCYQCNDCTIHCPRGARPGDVLAAVRSYVYKRYSFPSFMGKALATPAALPALLIVPALVLLALVFAFAPTTPGGEFVFLTSQVIDFDLFLTHTSIDVLFVFGNILIFIFAAIGFLRFWRDLQADNNEKRLSVIQAIIQTVKEILSHSRFNQCDANKSRSIGHMLLLYGFLGAMMTTGSVFVFVFVPHYLNLLGFEQLHPFFELPVDLPHAVKFLGGLSGIALVAGGLWLIVRRSANPDNVGTNAYVDYLFVWVVFLAGLTGMLSWLTRLIGIPMLAYANYYVHLIVVFFLLWYMPYSKFAHMFYRAMALTYAKSIGREPRT